MNNAKQIIKKHWDFKIPVNLNLIGDALGIELIKLSKDIDYDSEFKIIDGKPFVFYKGNLNITKERFCIAHQIGHYILSNSKKESYKCSSSLNCFNFYNNEEKEVIANMFALDLLVPEEALKTIFTYMKFEGVLDLAKKFNVSEVAMFYQLKKYKYIP